MAFAVTPSLGGCAKYEVDDGATLLDAGQRRRRTPGGKRLAITGYGALATRVRFATIDRHSGQLPLEPSVIDFTRV